MCMVESDDYKHLLTHPLVETFVTLKWLRLRRVFYLDFILYVVFAVLTLWSFYEHHSSSWINTMLKWATLTLNVVYMLGRRLLHFMFFSRNYWEILKNWWNWVIFTIVSFILFKDDIDLLDSEWCRRIAAICVLLINRRTLWMSNINQLILFCFF